MNYFNVRDMTPAPDLQTADPTCKICDRGTLTAAKILRLSGPAVLIGYVLLVPSIVGMACCAIGLIIALVVALGVLPNDSDGTAFIVGYSGLMTILLVSCFVSGLLGWLLVMKKDVLRCDNCGAVVNAHFPPSEK